MVGSDGARGRIRGRPSIHSQYKTYQEHFFKLRDPPDIERRCSQVWAMVSSLVIISGHERTPESAKPNEVSSTKVSMRQLC